MRECLLPATGVNADSVLVIAAAVVLAGAVALWIGRRRRLPTVLVAAVATGIALAVAGPVVATGPPCPTTTLPSVARQASSSDGADPSTSTTVTTSTPVVGGIPPEPSTSTTITTTATSTTTPAPTEPTIAAPSSTTTTSTTLAPTEATIAVPLSSTTTTTLPTTPPTTLPTTPPTTSGPNSGPVVGADVVVVSKDSGPVSGDVLANDFDPNGDTLVVFNPGTYTVSRGELILNSDGSYTFTVDVDHPGNAAMQSGQGWLLTFGLTIYDGRGAFVVTTMNVEIWGFDDP